MVVVIQIGVFDLPQMGGGHPLGAFDPVVGDILPSLGYISNPYTSNAAGRKIFRVVGSISIQEMDTSANRSPWGVSK